MKKILLNLALVSILTADPGSVLATQFLNPDEKGFKADSVYDDDIFLAGNRLKFDSKVRGDLFSFCYEIVQSDSINGNFNLFCYSIQSLGPVGGSFRSFSRYLSCNSTIGRNLLAFGQEITVGPNTEIGRDAHIFSESATFQGDVKGDLRAQTGQIVFSGSVGGDFVYEGAELVIGPDAVIDGDLIYTTPEKAEISSSARIDGEIRWTRAERKDAEDVSVLSAGKVLAWFMSHRGYFLWLTFVSFVFFIVSAIPFPTILALPALLITLLISGNLFILFTKDLSSRTEKVLKKRMFPSIGLGFAILFLTPVISFVLLLTVFLGGMLILIYGVACFAGGVYASLFIGRKICLVLNVGSESSAGYLCYSIGVFLLVVLSFIPVLGYLLSMLVIMMGLGGLALALFSDGELKEKASG